MRASEVTRASTSLERARRRDLVHDAYWRWSLTAVAIGLWLLAERLWR